MCWDGLAGLVADETLGEGAAELRGLTATLGWLLQPRLPQARPPLLGSQHS